MRRFLSLFVASFILIASMMSAVPAVIAATTPVATPSANNESVAGDWMESVDETGKPYWVDLRTGEFS